MGIRARDGSLWDYSINCFECYEGNIPIARHHKIYSRNFLFPGIYIVSQITSLRTGYKTDQAELKAIADKIKNRQITPQESLLLDEVDALAQSVRNIE